MSAPTTLLPFQPATMSTAQLAAVSYLARYAGRTHALYSYQLAQWFSWCQTNGLDPLVGVQRAHVELYIRGLGDRGLMDSSVNTMMHAVRGYLISPPAPPKKPSTAQPASTSTTPDPRRTYERDPSPPAARVSVAPAAGAGSLPAPASPNAG